VIGGTGCDILPIVLLLVLLTRLPCMYWPGCISAPGLLLPSLECALFGQSIAGVAENNRKIPPQSAGTGHRFSNSYTSAISFPTRHCNTGLIAYICNADPACGCAEWR
jgi:hypothetical protein